MKKNLVKVLSLAALLVSEVTLVSPVLADEIAALEAARRVNMAGRQRMLSQRMTKAACFISVGLDAENQQTVLRDGFDLFTFSHDALRFGDESVALDAEHNSALRRLLDVVSADWAAFAPLIGSSISSGLVSRPALVRIDETGLGLLDNMNRAVNKTANVYGQSLPDMPLLLSLTIDLAGRQRMFSQKAGKEFCLIDAGIAPVANQENLAQTTTLFTLTLQALIDGMPGMVMAAPNEEIRAKLEEVSEAWQGPKAVFEYAASGAVITDTERAVVTGDLERVLVLMNEAVGMYEQAIPEQE